MRKTLILLAAALAVPSLSFAQASANDEIEEIRKNAKIHVGPFYMTPLLRLKELGVDGNVFNAAGDQKSDFMFNLSPGADLWLPVARRALFTTSVATDLVWYRTYTGERSIDPQVSVRGEGYLHRLTVFAENAFVNSRQRPNFEIDIRSRHLRNDARVGAEYRITPKFSFEVAGRRLDTKYDADAVLVDGTSLQRTLNRRTVGVEATARHRVTPLTAVAVAYDNTRDRFEFSPSRDSKSYRVMPGIEFKPRALVSGSAFVGYRRFTPEDAVRLPAFEGVVAQLGLAYTLLGSTTFGVTYRRDLTYSYEERQPFFVDNAVGASIRRALGRRFDALVSVDRHRYEYRDLLPDPLTAGGFASDVLLDPRIDTTWNYAASLGYRVRRAARIGFGVAYWKRESTTVRFRDYDNLRIGTTATYGF